MRFPIFRDLAAGRSQTLSRRAASADRARRRLREPRRPRVRGDDGLAVVGAANSAAVLEDTRAVEAREAGRRGRVVAGESTLTILGIESPTHNSVGLWLDDLFELGRQRVPRSASTARMSQACLQQRPPRRALRPARELERLTARNHGVTARNPGCRDWWPSLSGIPERPVADATRVCVSAAIYAVATRACWSPLGVIAPQKSAARFSYFSDHGAAFGLVRSVPPGRFPTARRHWLPLLAEGGGLSAHPGRPPLSLGW
jgi:hypothetical protein